MIKVAVLLAVMLVALVALVVAIGYSLPVSHVATRSRDVPTSPAHTLARLTDLDAFPRWRSDVKSVEIVSRTPLRWREHGSNGDILFERTDTTPDRIVTRIADPSLPFGGTWTYALSPSPRGTLVTITERGEVYNPIFRFASRFVFGHTATIDRFLEDLARPAE